MQVKWVVLQAHCATLCSVKLYQALSFTVPHCAGILLQAQPWCAASATSLALVCSCPRAHTTSSCLPHTCPCINTVQLLDQEDALAFLTDRYRRAAYIVCALEKENRAGVGQNNMSSVETTARKLVAEMESAFVSEGALANLQAYFEVRHQHG